MGRNNGWHVSWLKRRGGCNQRRIFRTYTFKSFKKQFEHFNILKSKLFSFSKLQEQVTIKLYTADIEVYYINVKQMLYFKISPPIKTILS